jgi:CRP/FNR family transcriptional regulator, cyclic AMP receptor protein
MPTTLEPRLAQHPFFQGLDPQYLQLVVGCAANVVFPAGKVIFRMDEEADHFYLIRKGKVAIELYAPPRGTITIQTLHEGEVLGWSWLIPPYRPRFNARAVERTVAIGMDGRCLRGKCEVDHNLGYELLMKVVPILVSRLEATRIQLLDLYRV